MLKTEYLVSKMDCPSEENLIRVQLSEIKGIKKLEFDIANRRLTVYHTEENVEIGNKLIGLNLGAQQSGTSTVAKNEVEVDDATVQSKLLWSVLLINFGFFIIEMTTGLISKSMGLIADSLDMLADSFVYGISLLAIGTTVTTKKRVARLAGYFQIALASIGFIEVIRRFLDNDNLPNFSIMIVVSVFALIANGVSLYLLQKSKSKEAHMQASMIFTSNDVIINLGVIAAAVLVHFLNSGKPDLIIGTIVFAIVIRGAIRILKLGKQK